MKRITLPDIEEKEFIRCALCGFIHENLPHTLNIRFGNGIHIFDLSKYKGKLNKHPEFKKINGKYYRLNRRLKKFYKEGRYDQ